MKNDWSRAALRRCLEFGGFGERRGGPRVFAGRALIDSGVFFLCKEPLDSCGTLPGTFLKVILTPWTSTECTSPSLRRWHARRMSCHARLSSLGRPDLSPETAARARGFSAPDIA